VLSTGKQSTG